MILNETQLQTICTNTNEHRIYECILAKQKFAHALLKEQMFPLGNVISFNEATKIGPLMLNKALVFCAELLNTNTFGAACFQRLYSAQLGSILSEICKKDFYISENCIFLEEKQCTITTVNKVKDDAVFHIIFPIETNHEELHLLDLTEEDLKQFQTSAIDCFYDLLRSVFLETQSDNF